MRSRDATQVMAAPAWQTPALEKAKRDVEAAEARMLAAAKAWLGASPAERAQRSIERDRAQAVLVEARRRLVAATFGRT